MRTVTFLPWCPLREPINVGKATFLPFQRASRIGHLSDEEWSTLCKLLSVYKTIEGKPIENGALVRYEQKHLFEVLNQNEGDEVARAIDMLCFGSLASRVDPYFASDYCDSTCFIAYSQNFDSGDDLTFVTRRRTSKARSSRRTGDVAVSIPLQCHTIRDVDFDEPLLAALDVYRERVDLGQWTRWKDAIVCFNAANSDSDFIRPQVEWILYCSSIQRLHGNKTNAEDVANAVMSTIQSAGVRGCAGWGDWWTEFSRIRDDYAHGRMVSEKKASKSAHEHIYLATIAFPLLVKCKLLSEGAYSLSTNDVAQIESFAQLLAIPKFLEEPIPARGSCDSHWMRLVDSRRQELTIERLVSESIDDGCSPRA